MTRSWQHYRPEIDGLRSLAVLGVVLYHFNLLDFQGGFLGVDIFFVISGYLIGGLVFDEIARTGAVSFSGFWLRRARRILPALFCVLAITGVFAWGLLAGTTLMPAYARSLLASIFSVANFLFFSESGYFDDQALNKPLLHTWSLGVEEQFYALFPLAAYAGLVRPGIGGRPFAGVLLIAAVASWGACILGSLPPGSLPLGNLLGAYGESPGGGAENFAFFMLPTRLWEPLAGCILAHAARERLLPALPQRLCTPLEIAAALAILVCLRHAPHGIGFWNTLAASATLLLLHSRQGLISRLLSTRPFVWTGRISYSLYLWHWPILVLATLYWLRISQSYKISLLLLSVLCAWLSFRFVEQPFRREHIGWRHVGRRLLPVGAGLCVVGLAALLLRQAPLLETPAEPAADEFPYRSAAQIDQDNVRHVGTDPRVQFLAFGDSHMGCISPVLAEQAEAYGVGGAVVSAIGLFPHPDYQVADSFAERSALARSIHDYIKRNRVKTLLLAGRWHIYLFGRATKARWRMAWRGAPVHDNRDVFVRTMTEALREWLDAGISVYILEQVPEHNYDSLERAALVRPGGPAGEYAERIGFLRDLARTVNHPRLHLLRTAEVFRDGEDFIFVKDNKLLYQDYNHLNLFGARMLTDALAPFFAHVQAEADANPFSP